MVSNSIYNNSGVKLDTDCAVAILVLARTLNIYGTLFHIKTERGTMTLCYEEQGYALYYNKAIVQHIPISRAHTLGARTIIDHLLKEGTI